MGTLCIHRNLNHGLHRPIINLIASNVQIQRRRPGRLHHLPLCETDNVRLELINARFVQSGIACLPSVYIPDITWHHYIGWNLPDIVSSGKVSTLTGTLFFLYVWKFVRGAVKRGIQNKGIITLIDQKCFVTIADTACVELTAKLPFIYGSVIACWQYRIHLLPASARSTYDLDTTYGAMCRGLNTKRAVSKQV